MSTRAYVVGVIALSASASSAMGQVEILAVNNIPGGATPDRLVRFDSNNPSGWTPIGPITSVGNLGFTGLDFAGVGGDLYAWAGFGTSFANSGGLYRVNPATGAGTRITAGAALAGVNDLAWNPVLGRMYAVESATGVARLHEVDLTTGGLSLVGTFTGLLSASLNVGLAFDSVGRAYVHDVGNDRIYSGAGLGLTSLYTLPINTNFSQGMTIDWSRNDQGYHAAIGNSPAFFSELYTFNTLGTSYSLVGNFGTGSGTFPTFEGGDLAIRPIPAPSAAGVLALGGLLALRRRR